MKSSVVKAIGIYSIFIGLAVIGLWVMILATGSITEGSVEMTFHLISKFSMATLSIIAGILLLLKSHGGFYLTFTSLGMIIYSVLNAAGYYGQRNDLAFLMLFIGLLLFSVIALITLYQITRK